MTAPATPPDWDSIARYLSGESTAEEARVVRAWLDAHPGDRELVECLGDVMSAAPADVDVEAALARVHQRMDHAPQRPKLTLERGGASSAPRRSRLAWLGGFVAAAAVAGILITTLHRPRATTTQSPVRRYTTGVGKRDSITLADGSRVILGPRTTLEVPSSFGGTSRTVALAGDAWFDVTHDASKPFQVRSNGALIEDVGTTFTVESDGARGTTVAVVSGSVRLRRDSTATGGVLLSAGDRGSIDSTGQARVERNAVRDEDTAWISGRLAFRDAPLSQVAAELERWYGVKILVADSALREQHVTTSFEGESIDQALRILGLTMGASIERRGDSAIVSPMHGAPPAR
jgi:transmembrane sensor